MYLCIFEIVALCICVFVCVLALKKAYSLSLSLYLCTFSNTALWYWALWEFVFSTYTRLCIVHAWCIDRRKGSIVMQCNKCLPCSNLYQICFASLIMRPFCVILHEVRLHWGRLCVQMCRDTQMGAKAQSRYSGDSYKCSAMPIAINGFPAPISISFSSHLWYRLQANAIDSKGYQ